MNSFKPTGIMSKQHVLKEPGEVMYGALSQCVEQTLIVGFRSERDQLRCAIANFSPTEGLDRQEDNHSSKLGSSVSVWEVKTRMSAGLFVGDYR